jgi:ubiquinone/menaquinone biosynthesis C-methylase UbiE
MPDLKTSLHLDMWREYQTRDSLLERVRRAVREVLTPRIYGLEWGDPDVAAPLQFVRDRFVSPFVNPTQKALEIGPGGGRWTRYLVGFGELYVVDFHAEILRELRRTLSLSKMKFIQNNGYDFPGVEAESIDFLFSFGCFVHLDREIIAAYLDSIRHVLRRGGNAIIHYSDKSKIMAQINKSFSHNDPELMRSMVTSTGFRVVEEDLTTLWHSSIIRFTH